MFKKKFTIYIIKKVYEYIKKYLQYKKVYEYKKCTNIKKCMNIKKCINILKTFKKKSVLVSFLKKFTILNVGYIKRFLKSICNI